MPKSGKTDISMLMINVARNLKLYWTYKFIMKYWINSDQQRQWSMLGQTNSNVDSALVFALLNLHLEKS